MAIANGARVSFCNQTKAHYLATSRESRRYVVAYSRSAAAGFGYIVRQESIGLKAHFGLPWVRPFLLLWPSHVAKKSVFPIHYRPFLAYLLSLPSPL